MSADTESHNASLVGGDSMQARGPGPYVLRKILSRLERGSLTVVFPSGVRLVHRAATPGVEATLVLNSWRPFRRLASRGGVGFGESYMAGEWGSPDLGALLTLLAENVARLEETMAGFLPVRLMRRLGHMLKANSKRGARKNISFHYDLGNDFYRLWLDRTLTYSSAIYARADMTLEQAQQAKLDRVAELMELEGGDLKVLEIGCGWGALAVRLAHAGAYVTGLTLSTEQRTRAQALAAEEKLNERIDIRLQDYRDVTGTFDRIVSIEMLEAVGEQYWTTYFSTLKNRLAPGGIAVLQAITIDEARFEAYRADPDFIQHYIFPGGMLPTKAHMGRLAREAGLRLEVVEPFGQSYAVTLAEWRHRLDASWPLIEKQGFDQTFHRMWDYYLAYCEAGFRTGVIDVAFYKLSA